MWTNSAEKDMYLVTANEIANSCGSALAAVAPKIWESEFVGVRIEHLGRRSCGVMRA